MRSLKVNAQMIREPQAQLERLLERLELGSKESVMSLALSVRSIVGS